MNNFNQTFLSGNKNTFENDDMNDSQMEEESLTTETDTKPENNENEMTYLTSNTMIIKPLNPTSPLFKYIYKIQQRNHGDLLEIRNVVVQNYSNATINHSMVNQFAKEFQIQLQPSIIDFLLQKSIAQVYEQSSMVGGIFGIFIDGIRYLYQKFFYETQLINEIITIDNKITSLVSTLQDTLIYNVVERSPDEIVSMIFLIYHELCLLDKCFDLYIVHKHDMNNVDIRRIMVKYEVRSQRFDYNDYN